MKIKTHALILFIFFLFSLAGQAIITTNNAAAETDPFAITEFNWDYTVNFNGSSAVAIDSYWLLTAAHVADDAGNSTVTVNDQTYNQVGETYHSTADLALIRLDRALPDFYSIYMGTYPTNPDFKKLEGVMVGYGVTGTVLDQYNYTFNSTTGKGTERWGYNRIDEELNYIGTTGKTNSGLRMFFDTEDSSLEAGAGTGDSGGGVFVDDDGTWRLAGIMTDVSTASSSDAIYAIDVQDYSSWITETIPEPSSLMLVAGIAALFGVAHRIRCVFD